MASHRFRMGLGVLALVVTASGLRAGPPGREDSPPGDVAALAARIDEHIAAGYAASKATPAALTDDAAFLRRVYLDLAGRIPRSSEVQAFLADPSPAKRREWVDRLLDGPNYVAHFSRVWRSLLVPQTNNQAQAFGQQMEAWVRKRVKENTPYDEMVRELLTANLPFNGARRAVAQPLQPGQFDQGALAFYQANEFKPENVAAAASRLFLGVKLECAQCHDHPFDPWTRKQFWEFAAFFAGVQPQRPQPGRPAPAQIDPDARELSIPNTDKKVKAKFLDGVEPEWREGRSTRATLADWMTSAENPYFARAAVNRMWAHFFGIGIVEPVDGFGSEEHPPSHPELLDDLTAAFVASKFDPKFLIRAITASRTYQLGSAVTDKSQEDSRLFARMAIKGLTPEQLFDSLVVATGYRQETNPANPRLVQNPGNPRAEFLAKFANASDKRTEHQTSILQALALMNGRFIADQTDSDLSELGKSRSLAAILDLPTLDTPRKKLDALFLNTLSRPMRPEEASRLVPYVEKGGPSGDRNKALADVFWVLLNSSEFFLNH
jgi:hypothetical protein